jgi:formate hydrogenlyase transcriptional activator
VGRRVESIDTATMRRLVEYSWPGNIRELENLIERALILSNSNVLHVGPEILGPRVSTAVASPEIFVAPRTPNPERESAALPADSLLNDGSLADVQRTHMLRVLDATNWVIEGERGAAARLRMKPATLRFRMKKLGISRSDDRKS